MANNPFTFQNNTAYNASSLVGEQLSTVLFPSLILYFTNTGSYDGTATLQFSPNGGTTWFALPAYDLTAAVGTAVYSLASPVSTKAWLVGVPTNALLRVLMAGGSTGSLSAYGMLTSYVR